MFFSEFFSFPLSISFHCSSPYSCIICGMNNRPYGGRINMNKVTYNVLSSCFHFAEHLDVTVLSVEHHQNLNSLSQQLKLATILCILGENMLSYYIMVCTHISRDNNNSNKLIMNWEKTTITRFLTVVFVLTACSQSPICLPMSEPIETVGGFGCQTTQSLHSLCCSTWIFWATSRH
jgi:hypothetical protein